MAGKKPGPKKGSGGRPKKTLTANQIKQVERMAALGMDQESICRVLDISERTFRNRKKEEAELSAAYKKGRAAGQEMATNKLFTLIKEGNSSAIFFYLKTQHGWKETQKVESKQEISGSGGGPIQLASFKPEEMSDEELRRAASEE